MKKALTGLFILLGFSVFAQQQFVIATNDSGEDHAVGLHNVRRIMDNPAGGSFIFTGNRLKRWNADESMATIVANSCNLFFTITAIDWPVRGTNTQIALSTLFLVDILPVPNATNAIVMMDNPRRPFETVETYASIVAAVEQCATQGGGGADNWGTQSALTQFSVQGDGTNSDTIQLVGDISTPNNNASYGTDIDGSRGWSVGGGTVWWKQFKAAHGFSVGDILSWNGTSWELASTINTGKLHEGMVGHVSHADTFHIVIPGELINIPSHGYTKWVWYFASDTDNVLTDTPDADTDDVVLIATDDPDWVILVNNRAQAGIVPRAAQLEDLDADTRIELFEGSADAILFYVDNQQVLSLYDSIATFGGSVTEVSIKGHIKTDGNIISKSDGTKDIAVTQGMIFVDDGTQGGNNNLFFKRGSDTTYYDLILGEIWVSGAPLVGMAPSNIEFGIDTTNEVIYYVAGDSTWAALPNTDTYLGSTDQTLATDREIFLNGFELTIEGLADVVRFFNDGGMMVGAIVDTLEYNSIFKVFKDTVNYILAEGKNLTGYSARDTTNDNWVFMGVDTSSWIVYDNRFSIALADAGDLYNDITGPLTEYLTIQGGNTGLNNSAPDNRLDVVGDLEIDFIPVDSAFFTMQMMNSNDAGLDGVYMRTADTLTGATLTTTFWMSDSSAVDTFPVISLEAARSDVNILSYARIGATENILRLEPNATEWQQLSMDSLDGEWKLTGTGEYTVFDLDRDMAGMQYYDTGTDYYSYMRVFDADAYGTWAQIEARADDVSISTGSQYRPSGLLKDYVMKNIYAGTGDTVDVSAMYLAVDSAQMFHRVNIVDDNTFANIGIYADKDSVSLFFKKPFGGATGDNHLFTFNEDLNVTVDQVYWNTTLGTDSTGKVLMRQQTTGEMTEVDPADMDIWSARVITADTSILATDKMITANATLGNVTINIDAATFSNPDGQVIHINTINNTAGADTVKINVVSGTLYYQTSTATNIDLNNQKQLILKYDGSQWFAFE